MDESDMEVLKSYNERSQRDCKTSLPDHSDHIRVLKEDKARAEHKLKLLRQRQEEELMLFNDAIIGNILKNSGAREYFERMKERNKIQDDLIIRLREELQSKLREIAALENKNKDIKKQLNQYMKAWKDAQMAKESLENERKVHQSRFSKRVIPNSLNHSSTSSIVNNRIPSPPPAEPSVEEIMQTISSPRDNSSTRSFSIDIPPTQLNASLEDILNKPTKKAFEQEEGQFICHAYVNVDLESSIDSINEVVDLISSKQNSRNMDQKALPGLWKTIGNETEDKTSKSIPHVTLIRGHRAIHYHQIKPLVELIIKECETIKPFSIFLDRLEIFHNYEKTKQFLCIAARPNQLSSQLSCLKDLRMRLKSAIDQFATRLTLEDETEDTLAHCSLMSRDADHAQTADQLESELEDLDTLWSEVPDEFPICIVKVDTVCVMIGNHIYKCKLSG